MPASSTGHPLRVIPLGGLGEIGKNMLALEYGDDIVVIDCGVLFPEEDMPGVDLVIPDISYLLEHKDKVRAILITHGHEDHTGALPYVLPRLNVPVYAPRLAHGLIRAKLQQHRNARNAQIEAIEPGLPIDLGCFQADFFRVCHSIPDSMGIALQTPLGTVIHTGDFKIDHTPVDGKPTDLGSLGVRSLKGVLLLLSDSTYAEVSGYTPSEQVVGEALDRVIGKANGRVLVATFASHISRVQQILDAAWRNNRKVAVVGRSMSDNVRLCLNMGYLTAPESLIVPISEANGLAAERVVVITTGSQGEPTSALVRMASNKHHDVKIASGDTVIMSANPIPGNETLIGRTIDNLGRLGARVLYDKVALVHVHGHASSEELKIVLNLVSPRYFVPVHGEYRHLTAHSELALAVGIPADGIFVLEDGDVLEITGEGACVTGKVPAGHIYVEGHRLRDGSSKVLEERSLLSREGIITINLQVDRSSGSLVGVPEVNSKGLMDQEEALDVIAKVTGLARTRLHDSSYESANAKDIKTNLTESARDLVYKHTGRRPIIMMSIVEV